MAMAAEDEEEEELRRKQEPSLGATRFAFIVTRRITKVTSPCVMAVGTRCERAEKCGGDGATSTRPEIVRPRFAA